MNEEETRLRTFNDWPADAPEEAAHLARRGFFRTGRGLEVQCYSCGVRVRDWAGGERAAARHRRLQPRCPFVLDPRAAGDVPADGRAPSPPSPPPDADSVYKADALRIMSFSSWPVSFISAESLALAGFYYVRGAGAGGAAGGDRVRCAWCEGELQDWRRGDIPLAEHVRHFPHCSYASQRLSLSNSETTRNSSLSVGSEPGIVEAGAGELQALEARVSSFPGDWGARCPLQPSALAAAGFSYVGLNDQVRCFQCGIELCRWQAEDDAWVEHAKWSADCGFLQRARGKSFAEQHRRAAPSEAAVERCMEGALATAALACGLLPDAVRAAIRKRLQDTGNTFQSTEALIDAALNEQPADGSPTAVVPAPQPSNDNAREDGGAEEAPVSLEEENRRLKEARLCKVCMDAEVSVVFLPCGHLLSCVRCAPCLPACPLCRSQVKGIVRTYLS